MKRKLLTTLFALGAVSTFGVAPLSAQAASLNDIAALKNNCPNPIVISNQINSLEEVRQLLADYGIDCDLSNLPDCNLPNLPGNGGSQTPDKPEVEVPGTPETPEKPETEKPEDKPSEGTNSNVSYVQQIVNLVNAERAKVGLAPLTLDTTVTKAAQVRAEEIVSSFSHTRPNGTSFATALKEAGASYRGAGENIAWGQKSPEAVMNAWMNSDGHRANILDKNFTTIGVGYYQNANGTNYWSQLFTY